MLLDGDPQGIDCVVEEGQVVEDLAAQQGVHGLEAALKRFPQSRRLRLEASSGEVREGLRIGGPADESFNHRPPRDPENVGGNGGELDPGILEHLVQAVGLSLTLGDLRLGLARELPKLPDGFGRNEARPEQAVLEELGDPGRVGDVGLATGHVAHVGGVDHDRVHGSFEDVEHGAPEDPRGLHRDVGDAVADEPVEKGEQPLGRGGELLLVLHPASVKSRHPGAGGDLVPVDVEARTAFMDGFQASSLLARSSF